VRTVAITMVLAILAGCGGGHHRHRARASSAGSEAPAPSPPAETVGAPVEPAPQPAPSEAPAEPTTDWASAPALESFTGRVSFYADSLSGHRTANGERYDPHALTCASRDLPFGSLVRVTRLDTGASVVVRVNDRGPWGRRTRILDLSRAAAEAIDMIRAGVVEVRADVVRRGE
jgi:rare lipoprotein A